MQKPPKGRHEDFSHPQLRRDPLGGRWTILAPGRSQRPGGKAREETAVAGGGSEGEADGASFPCPFCPGNEALTPPEVWAEGREGGVPDSPGWKIRVVPNLYPALQEEGKGVPRHARGGASRPARGRHEVIIHTPEHDLPLSRMEAEDAVRLMRAYRLRYSALCAVSGVKQVLFIVNHGREAGASLAHPHTQAFALPLVTHVLREELRNARRLYERACPLCAEREEARREGRVVMENDGWTALAPFASRLPYETWFIPRRHEPDFARARDGELRGMAEVLTRTLAALAGALGDPPYNLWLHAAPCDGNRYHFFHYHLELVPRLTVEAGFEMASGVHINVVPPEEAARRLRDSMP